MKIKNKLLYCLIFMIMFCFTGNVKAAIYSDSQVGNYETELAKFPIAYKKEIEKLHIIYPKAVFVAQDKFFDWDIYKEVEVDWNDMLNAELVENPIKSEIEKSAPSNYRKTKCGEYANNGTCSWYMASKAGIEYYMNPYNFLDETHIFMFQSQYFSVFETEQGINEILSDAYKNKDCPGSNGKTYAQVILEASKRNNISAYMLASRLRQENVLGDSPLVKGRCYNDSSEGCIKYYNLFNIQASGSTNEKKIENGIKCASGNLLNSKGKKICKDSPWTSPYLSILGTAKFLYMTYIGANDIYEVKGQMTNYLQKWDPYGPAYAGKQFMQNIRAPYFESQTTYSSYIKYVGYKYRYIFYIPIYKNAPNTSKISYNIDGNYISKIDVNTSQNSLINNIKKVYENATIKIIKNSNNKTYNLATGDIIEINYNNEIVKYTAVVTGDVNGDGKVLATDYVKVKNHIMSDSSKLSGAYEKAADVNGDGFVKATDYVLIKKSIMK